LPRKSVRSWMWHAGSSVKPSRRDAPSPVDLRTSRLRGVAAVGKPAAPNCTSSHSNYSA
jgi:hypothetical protein